MIEVVNYIKVHKIDGNGPEDEDLDQIMVESSDEHGMVNLAVDGVKYTIRAADLRTAIDNAMNCARVGSATRYSQKLWIA